MLMLKTLDPLLNADVLHALRSMGHGDELVICDTNFPADSVAMQTAYGRILRIDGTCARVTRIAHGGGGRAQKTSGRSQRSASGN
jgi:L-fucose mutarotase